MSLLHPSHPPSYTAKLYLIALPLPTAFNPPLGSFSRNRLQDGDKISLPKSYWDAICPKGVVQLEVPWVVRVSRADGVAGVSAAEGRVLQPTGVSKVTYKSYLPSSSAATVLSSPLDFRAPENYVFLPDWMFRHLGLRPGEAVSCELDTGVPKGGRVSLRPVTFRSGGPCDDGAAVGTAKEFLAIENHQAVLETELKHYSTLTQGSVVSFKFGEKR